MERTTATLDLFAPWARAQETFWERWRAALANGTPAPAAPFGIWGLDLEFWKVAIFEGLDLQLAMAETWKESMCASNVPIPEFQIGTCQAIHFFEDWTRSQMQLWQGWFAALESLAPQGGEPPAAPERPHGRRAPRERAHAHAANGVAP